MFFILVAFLAVWGIVLLSYESILKRLGLGWWVAEKDELRRQKAIARIKKYDSAYNWVCPQCGEKDYVWEEVEGDQPEANPGFGDRGGLTDSRRLLCRTCGVEPAVE